jgi:hypothetical protein
MSGGPGPDRLGFALQRCEARQGHGVCGRARSRRSHRARAGPGDLHPEVAGSCDVGPALRAASRSLAATAHFAAAAMIARTIASLSLRSRAGRNPALDPLDQISPDMGNVHGDVRDPRGALNRIGRHQSLQVDQGTAPTAGGRTSMGPAPRLAAYRGCRRRSTARQSPACPWHSE